MSIRSLNVRCRVAIIGWQGWQVLQRFTLEDSVYPKRSGKSTSCKKPTDWWFMCLMSHLCHIYVLRHIYLISLTYLWHIYDISMTYLCNIYISMYLWGILLAQERSSGRSGYRRSGRLVSQIDPHSIGESRAFRRNSTNWDSTSWGTHINGSFISWNILLYIYI